MNDSLGRWWSTVSLRSKITGVTVLVLVFGLLMSGVGTVMMLRPILERQVDENLVTIAQGDISEMFAFTRPSGADGGVQVDVQERDEFVALYDFDFELKGRNWVGAAPGVVPAIPSRLDAERVAAYRDGPIAIPSVNGNQTYRTYVVPVTNSGDGTRFGYMLIASSTRSAENIIATYLTIFFGLGIGVIAVSAVLTRLLVTNTFAPLRDVENTAASIAGGDFSQRMSSSTANTEVGRLNRSLNLMLSRIDQAFGDRARTIEQMRRFVGDASHELRTPLVTVRGYAELYRMGALQNSDDIASAMERIEKEALRMGGLVEDLLELARLDEARPRTLAPVDLTMIARDAAMDARAAAPERTISVVIDRPGSTEADDAEAAAATGAQDEPVELEQDSSATGPIAFAGQTLARLRSRLPRRTTGPIVTPDSPIKPTIEVVPDTPAIVLGEENKLRQVVTNLMGNAQRFSPGDSPLEIGVSANAATNRATIAVIDHGEGIPPQIREKVFQRFWRADTSRARETGGSGLGLAIVSSIVQAHGGTVSVGETPGGGATFRVELDLVSPTEREPDAAPTAVEQAEPASAGDGTAVRSTDGTEPQSSASGPARTRGEGAPRSRYTGADDAPTAGSDA